MTQSYADIAHELARAYVLMSTLLAEGVGYGIGRDPAKFALKYVGCESTFSL